MTVVAEPKPLTLQMLAWLDGAPRTYGEAMEAWRTSCPRLSIWEDALADGLIFVRPAGPGAGGQAAVVALTAAGNEVLERFAMRSTADRRP